MVRDVAQVAKGVGLREGSLQRERSGAAWVEKVVVVVVGGGLRVVRRGRSGRSCCVSGMSGGGGVDVIDSEETDDGQGEVMVGGVDSGDFLILDEGSCNLWSFVCRLGLPSWWMKSGSSGNRTSGGETSVCIMTGLLDTILSKTSVLAGGLLLMAEFGATWSEATEVLVEFTSICASARGVLFLSLAWTPETVLVASSTSFSSSSKYLSLPKRFSIFSFSFPLSSSFE